MGELTEGLDTIAGARETFWRRLELLHKELVVEKSTLWRGAGSLAVEMGAQSEDAAKFNRASALYFHLFGYELLNSVVVLREGELHVLARSEKGAELDRILGKQNPFASNANTHDANETGSANKNSSANEDHPRIKLKIHIWESAASVQPLVSAAAAAGPTLGVLRSGGSARCSSSSGGSLLRAWDAAVSIQGFILVDVTRAVGACLAIKDDEAIIRTAAAGRVACRALCDGVTRLVEAAFDADREERATHDALAQQIDALMCDALAPHCARAVPKLQDVNDASAKRCAAAAAVACGNAAATARSTRLVESCYFPIVTSGGACTTDAGAASDADAINDDVVVVEFGARFASYCTNVARTFFVEPLPSLEKCYAALRGVHAACVDAMRHGQPLSSVATAAHAYLEANENAHLAKFLPKHNFGFALGLDFRDDDLVLTRNNPRNFQARMIFNVAIGLHNVPLDAGERRKARGAIRELKKISMLLADTVLVQSGGAPPVVLTDFSATRPALKDWRDVSNLATSQRERAAALAAQRAAAAEAELLAQLDAEDAGGNNKNGVSQPSKKASKKSKKKQIGADAPAATITPPPPSESSPKEEKTTPAAEETRPANNTTPEESVVPAAPEKSDSDDEQEEEEDEETEAEALQLLERVRAAGRSRWCESCEAAVRAAQTFSTNYFLKTGGRFQQSSSSSVAALERATRELAESMVAWRGIERLLEHAQSADALRNALNKASSAGFPAKATAVKRARRRLKEFENGGTVGEEQSNEDTAPSVNSKKLETNNVDREASPTSTLERETKAQIQLGVVASQQAFTEIVGPNKRSSNNKERTPKAVDELSKYFHGDEHEIAQLREQRMDLTKLVILAGRGAPKLAPWRDSQPPNNAVAVGRVLGLLGRLAPRVFVNLNAAERSGLLVRGGSPPREWLALAQDPGDNALDDAKLDDAVVQAAAQAANKGYPELTRSAFTSGTSAAAIQQQFVAATTNQSQQHSAVDAKRKNKTQQQRGWTGQHNKTVGSQEDGSVLSDNLDVEFPSVQSSSLQNMGTKSEASVPTEPSLGQLFSSASNTSMAPPGAPAGSPPRRAFTKSPEEGFMAPPGVSSRRQPLSGSLEWRSNSGIESPLANANAAAQQAAKVPSALTSSWDATPDSFLATRDEISAMAGAAYAAALGGGGPLPSSSSGNIPPSTRRVVGSGLLGAEQPPIGPGPSSVFLGGNSHHPPPRIGPPQRVQSLPGVNLGNESPLVSSSSPMSATEQQAFYGLGSTLGHLVLAGDDVNSPQSLVGSGGQRHDTAYDNGTRGSFFAPAPMGTPVTSAFSSSNSQQQQQQQPVNDANRRRRRTDDFVTSLGPDASLIDRGALFVPSGPPPGVHLPSPGNNFNSQFNDFRRLVTGGPDIQPPPGVANRRRNDPNTKADFIPGQPFLAPPSAVD